MKKFTRIFTTMALCAAFLTGTALSFTNTTEAVVHQPNIMQLDQRDDQTPPPPQQPQRPHTHHQEAPAPEWQG